EAARDHRGAADRPRRRRLRGRRQARRGAEHRGPGRLRRPEGPGVRARLSEGLQGDARAARGGRQHPLAGRRGGPDRLPAAGRGRPHRARQGVLRAGRRGPEGRQPGAARRLEDRLGEAPLARRRRGGPDDRGALRRADGGRRPGDPHDRPPGPDEGGRAAQRPPPRPRGGLRGLRAAQGPRDPADRM
ncbi:MAG: hypothetical protein AVDCRST_MAG30-694, partial [uncultured Solirubrobacteraceae bacterium]